MAEEANGDSRSASRERSELGSGVLADALEATDCQLRRLHRLVRDGQILDTEDAQKALKPARRRLRENRELLGREDEQRDRGDLLDALEATDRQLRRLHRLVRDGQILDTEDAQKALKPARRRLCENRELLGREDEQRDRDEVQDGRDDENGSAREDTERDKQHDDRPEQKITAPSLGPNTVIEREPVEERLARHEQSETDAMGLDKRRSVVGESFGPSKTRQLVVYLGFLAILAALVVGGIILVGAVDTSVGKHVPNSAPWSKPDAKQIQPKPIQ